MSTVAIVTTRAVTRAVGRVLVVDDGKVRGCIQGLTRGRQQPILVPTTAHCTQHVTVSELVHAQSKQHANMRTSRA